MFATVFCQLVTFTRSLQVNFSVRDEDAGYEEGRMDRLGEEAPACDGSLEDNGALFGSRHTGV